MIPSFPVPGMCVAYLQHSLLSQAVQRARDAFKCGTTLSLDFRKRQLKALKRMYEENEAALCAALAKDLKKVREWTKF